MNITFADLLGGIILIVPVIQPPIKFSMQGKHETFNTLKQGDIILLGGKGLRAVEWSSFFPVNKKYYNFTKFGSVANGKEYVTFLEEHMQDETPFRLIITEKTKTIRNMLVVVDSFEWEYDKVGDISYSLKLVEYPNNASIL